MSSFVSILKDSIVGRMLFQWKRPIVPSNIALRNSLSIVLPLGICIALGHPVIGMAIASGAMNVVFSDRPGPYKLRLERMLFASLGVAISAFAGFSLGAYEWLIMPVIAFWAFGCAMLVCLGPAAAQVGSGALVVLVITSTRPTPFWDALGAAGLFFAGGCIATLFAIMAWPLLRYRPERMAVADVYRQLSELARDRSSTMSALPVTEALNDVQDLLLGKHHANGRAMEAFYVLTQLAERIRMEILVLLDQRSRLDCPDLQEVLKQAAIVLRGISVALYRARPPQAAEVALKAFEEAVRKFDQTCQTTGDVQQWSARHIADARALGLSGQLRAAVRNSNYAGSLGEERAQLKEAQLPRSLQTGDPISILRANLSWSSVAFRHAIRCVVCMLAAVAVYVYFDLPQGYWLPMTTAVVLKPEFGNTFSFGLLRTLGTFLGAIVATAIMALGFTGPLQIVVLIGILYFAFRRMVTIHYGIAISLLTAVVVLLLSLEGFPPEEAIIDRGLCTLLGSLVAIVTYLLWPTWERGRERGMIADMLAAYSQYFQAVLFDDDRLCYEARVTARYRRTNVIASLERLRNEPNNIERVKRAESIFATSLLYTRAALAFEAAMDDHPDKHILKAPHARELGDIIVQAMMEMSHAVRENRAPVMLIDLRKCYRNLVLELEQNGDDKDFLALSFLDTCDRMINSVNTLSYILSNPEHPTIDHVAAVA
ncbi:FUSC family protein [Microvirga sp. W0021]|uniref:FUSC family protein n=1 Tax=Hohaiivirga grylli TaxID=3133970 RepID=A0ABV0BM34_9HYPH